MTSTYVTISDNQTPTEMDTADLESTKAPRRRLPAVPLGILAVIGIIIIFLGFGQIISAFADVVPSNETFRLRFVVYFISPYLCIIGGCVIAAAISANPHDMASWAVFHWCTMLFLLFIVTLGAIADFTMTLSMAATSVVLEMATSIILTVFAARGW